MRRIGMLAIAVLLLSVPVQAAEPAPPKTLEDAAPNTWVKLCSGDELRRASAGMVWAPKERAFVLFGGAMGMWKKGSAPYTELTLNLKERRWENRFPTGKLGVWGELTGPSNAPGFPGRSYYGVYMKDSEGTPRPYLGSGYDRAMYQYNNYAWDSDRGVVVVVWHWGKVTAEYDPAKRTWHIIDVAKTAPPEMWDDFLWGAMCYDPVNKEVLGGRGRWAYSTKTGKWRRLEFKNAMLASIHGVAKRLRLRATDLVGRCRSRYYHSETPEEGKAKLDMTAAEIEKAAARLAYTLTYVIMDASAHEPTEERLAQKEVAAARAKLQAAAALLKARVTAGAIHAVEDARDHFERAALFVAVQPPRRAFSAMAYDPMRRKIVMFGGDRLDRKLADTWIYHCQTRRWHQRFPKVSPPPRAGHGLVYLPKAKKILLVDGYGIGRAGQCWVYDTARNTWALLAEPNAGKRPALTPWPRYRFLPGPVAVSSDDVVVLTRRGEVARRRPDHNGTWAARIDATKIDDAGTAKLGVPPLTMSRVGRAQNPRWFEKTGPPPDPSAEKNLDNLPANTWVRLTPPNNPKLNRAWGTTVIDTARDQILQWGGGHAAYCGNDILHYSIKTNRHSIGSFYPDFQLNWNGSMLGPPLTMTFGGRPHCRHGYHYYGFDPVSKKLMVYSSHAQRFFIYDPLARDWRGTFGRRYKRGSHFIICCPTPKGLVAWIRGSLVVRLNAKTMTWEKLPVNGKLPGQRPDYHGMAYDTKRDRLLFFSHYQKGRVTVCNAKTGAVTQIMPAGADRVTSLVAREAMYVPHADAVMIGRTARLSDGKSHWLFYDCARNAWIGVRLPGKHAGAGVSTGLMYDTRRKLIWAANAYMTIAVLRLDLKTAQIRQLKDEPAPPPAKKRR